MSCEDYFCPFTKQRCKSNCPFYSKQDDDCLLAMACYWLVEKLNREHQACLEEQKKQKELRRYQEGYFEDYEKFFKD